MDRKINVIEMAMNCIKENKNFLIQGGAGSGKTETLKKLLNKISVDLKDKSVVCITHTNVAVDEIKARTKNQYPVYTIHTFLYSIIHNYRKNIKEVLPDIFKVDTLEKECINKGKNEIDYEIYKNIYEKYWKKQYKINPGATTEKIVGKKVYSEFPKIYNEELQKKIDKLNLQIENIVKEKCDYRKIRYNQSKFDSLKNFSYGHDSLLKIFNLMIKKYPVLLKIINDTYDLILIDEYQDTNSEVVDTFINLVGNGKTVIGLFGDNMQAIYKDGIGDVKKYVDENLIVEIKKEDNYRCSQQVIDFLNYIRNDLTQKIALKENETIEERQGKVKLYYKIDNQKPKLYSKDSQKEKEEYINRLDAFSNDVMKKINLKTKEYKVLLLANSALSKKLHFDNLYTIFSNRYMEVKDEIEKLCDKLGWLDLAEMYLYFCDEQYKNHNKLIQCLKNNGYIIETQNDKKKIIDVLKKISIEKSTISEVLSLLVKNKMYKEKESRNDELNLMKKRIKENENNKKLLEFIDNYKTYKTLTKMGKEGINITQEEYDYYSNLMKEIEFSKVIVKEEINFSEIINYKKYLDEKLEYCTMHKTKGTSIDNVIVILDEYFWGSYNFEKMIKQEEGPTLQNTKKLFYVACSRAKKDLIIIRIINPTEEGDLLKYFDKNVCEVEKIE